MCALQCTNLNGQSQSACHIVLSSSRKMGNQTVSKYPFTIMSASRKQSRKCQLVGSRAGSDKVLPGDGGVREENIPILNRVDRESFPEACKSNTGYIQHHEQY